MYIYIEYYDLSSMNFVYDNFRTYYANLIQMYNITYTDSMKSYDDLENMLGVTLVIIVLISSIIIIMIFPLYALV